MHAMSHVTDHPAASIGRRTHRSPRRSLVRAWVGRDGSPGALLDRIGGVDQVGVNERVDSLKKRSIKQASKVWALDLTHPDDGSDDARGKGHAGQGPGAVRQGYPPRAGRPDHPVGGRRVRLPGAGASRQGGP